MNISPDIVAILFWSIITLMFTILFYNLFKSVLWWRASSKYVKEDMKINDTVYISNISRENSGKVLEIRENEVDVIITVSKTAIYLPSK